jgi:two-component system, LytTR family, response regulator LytT
MTPLRVLVLEDEWLARKYLAQLIEATGLARVVGAVASLGEAKRFLTENQVDIVFLDVQLAGGENGLDLIGSIPPDVKRPAFVLATAYTQYARKAGDLGAVDSLLKPFSEERVEQCLRRLIHPSGTASPR